MALRLSEGLGLARDNALPSDWIGCMRAAPSDVSNKSFGGLQRRDVFGCDARERKFYAPVPERRARKSSLPADVEKTALWGAVNKWASEVEGFGKAVHTRFN